MSGGPQDASINGDGFRFYRWEPKCENHDPNSGPGSDQCANHPEPTDVLSVTSIRKLCGESYQLVAWQIGNVVNVATGMTKRTVIGPRGGRKDVYVQDGPFPGPFVRQMIAGEGRQASLDSIRKWLRDTADAPRDTAAVRGTIVHEAIELNARVDNIDEAYIESAIGRLSSRDRKKMETKGGVTAEDVDFVGLCVGQYWDMRVKVPFVILAKEPQVWNLEAGYAGSADVLIWFLPEGTSANDLRVYQTLADQGAVTQAVVEKVGGHVTLGDWKTSKGVYTDQVVQVHAYLAAKFIGHDGVIDQRLTDILVASNTAAIIHIRPEGWAIHFIDFEAAPLRAFLGSCAFARFVAMYPDPQPLFTHDLKGSLGE